MLEKLKYYAATLIIFLSQAALRRAISTAIVMALTAFGGVVLDVDQLDTVLIGVFAALAIAAAAWSKHTPKIDPPVPPADIDPPSEAG